MKLSKKSLLAHYEKDLFYFSNRYLDMDNKITNDLTSDDFLKLFDCLYIPKHSFSYNGLNSLYKYLWDLEHKTKKKITIDIDSICREYTEYKDIQNFQTVHGLKHTTIDNIKNETEVIQISKLNKDNRRIKLNSFIIKHEERITK